MLAVVLAALAVFAALLAADLRRWQDGVAAGDLRYRSAPAAARWVAPTVLPWDPAGRILDAGRVVSFRRAVRGFVVADSAGQGYDNGFSETRSRADAESALTDAAHAAAPRLASQADDLLGILAFGDSQQHGPTQPAPVERSVADFQAAVRLDPGNAAAKTNLELLLRQLIAHGVRAGAGGTGGPATGHRGANSGGAGNGY